MNIYENINYLKFKEEHYKTGICDLDLFEKSIMIYKNYLDSDQSIVVVENNLFEATKLYEQLNNLLDQEFLAFFAFDETLRLESIAASPELNEYRIESLANISKNRKMIIVTHSLALVKPIMDKDDYLNKIINIKVDEEIDTKILIQSLIDNNYHRVNRLSQPGQYCIRGSVIDIYSPNSDYPIRLDIFDTLIESIKYFDITSQRSRISIDEFKIYPNTLYNIQENEYLLNRIDEELKDNSNKEEIKDNIINIYETNLDLFYSRYYHFVTNKNNILDYVDNYILLLSSYDEIESNINFIINETAQFNVSLSNEKKDFIQEHYDNLANIKLNKFININKIRTNFKQDTFELKNITQLQNPIEVVDIIKEYTNRFYHVYLNINKKHNLDTITNILDNNDISYSKDEYSKNDVSIIDQEISRGFEDEVNKIVVLTELEIFKVNKRKRNFLNKYSNAIDILSLDDLNKNDYVVHQYHGIGQYLGIVQLTDNNKIRDYLHIVYKNSDKLYIPIENFNLVKKYQSSEHASPKLNNLGGTEWKKTKNKITKKIEDMLDELLDLYAIRKQPKGYQFLVDDYLQEQFESEFEYELTPDQKKAINEVKQDMESNQIMDRLICGDVGYGKTEVAIRAIFKAINNGKQVAFLCPTTILARQHYMTLLDRFQNYPIEVGQLSRNVSTKDSKVVIEKLKNKKIDVVVGTHRLLSNDVEFNDIGLLVIDEEQRFGVKDKEKIKQIKNNVDVLTLSATPIPRTLQMSLTKLRDMSLLQTPPINRIPIQTYVVAKNDHLIEEVIKREIARNGQVFYLYNKTMDIEDVVLKISEMDENIKVASIHGKMTKAKVESVMEKFDNNEYNVLVCTTIIETGIDIPNANTIIIEDANNFGLAQLYQIKGRVGRSDRIAYAYLLYNEQKVISEQATQRLTAIKELTKLGSGYKIALRDLAIRGAGDLLGKNQAGNIENIGYDMYLELLQEVIDKKNNVEKEEEIEQINLNENGYIPKDYELSDNNKLELYQKIYKIKRVEDFDKLEEEFNDIYGKLPISVKNIIEKRKFEIIVNNLKLKNITETDKHLTIQLNTNVNDKEKTKKIFEICDDHQGLVAIEIKYMKIHLNFIKVKLYLKSTNEILLDLKEFL